MPTTKKRTGSRAAPQAEPGDGETERRILDAARRVFTARGSAGARMQEIAAEAGVNQALLHYYFRTKELLAHAVFKEAAAKLFPGVMRILGAEVPLETRVEQVVHHYIDTLREHPFLPGFVLGELSFHPERVSMLAATMGMDGDASRDQRRRMLASLGDELARRAVAGEFRPMTAEQLMVNLASLCVFPFAARPMIATMLDFDQAAWERFLDARRVDLPEFILNSLRA
jgi:AcrR family transcriptional regulator